MKVKLIGEYGYDQALLGMGLSHGVTANKMVADIKNDQTLKEKLDGIALRLVHMKGGGHSKFLESMVVWVDLSAPRFWWQDFDTYRIGMTKLSESTNHTITKRLLAADDFTEDTLPEQIGPVNQLIKYWRAIDGNHNQLRRDIFHKIKSNLPEGFLQRRTACTNYKTLRNILIQRQGHVLYEFKDFADAVRSQVAHPELLPEAK